MMKKFIVSVVGCYTTVDADQGDSSMCSIAEEFDIMILKVRKILITAGVFQQKLVMKEMICFREERVF